MSMWIMELFRSLGESSASGSVKSPLFLWSGRLGNLCPWSGLSGISGSSTFRGGHVRKWSWIENHVLFKNDGHQFFICELCTSNGFLLAQFHGSYHSLKQASRFTIHLTLFSAKHCFTPGFLISSVIYLDADLKVVPLCETIWKGKPCLAVNLQKLLGNASGVKFGTM